MNIKIATWNMGHWLHKKESSKAWDFLINEISADITLVQEAKPLNNYFNNNIVWKEIGKNRKWGSGIITKNLPIKEFSFKNNYPGSLVGAEISLPNGLIITAFSLYGILDEFGYAITTLHRMFSDLTPILVGLVGRKRNIIICGDFNADVQFDKKQNNNSHKIFFNRVEDFGIVNCFSKFYSSPVQTLRHKKSNL